MNHRSGFGIAPGTDPQRLVFCAAETCDWHRVILADDFDALADAHEEWVAHDRHAHPYVRSA